MKISIRIVGFRVEIQIEYRLNTKHARWTLDRKIRSVHK